MDKKQKIIQWALMLFLSNSVCLVEGSAHQVNSNNKHESMHPQDLSMQERLTLTISKYFNLSEISRKIWEELIGGNPLEEIKAFKKEHFFVFHAFSRGKTWSSLKKELDIEMVKNIPGLNYSWEGFRGIDQAFKEQLVNKAMPKFEFSPVYWETTGTAGYASDIDNVAKGTSPQQEIIAKILMDSLHYYMYGKTSDITFDEEVYTQHPGATLKTMSELGSKEGKEKHEKIAFSLAQLQIHRNLKGARSYSWEQYKKEFIQIFPDIQEVLEHVERFDLDLSKVIEKGKLDFVRKNKTNKNFAEEEVSALINFKAISILSQQINQYSQKTNHLIDAIKSVQAMNILRKKDETSRQIEDVIKAAIKEKDDLLNQESLLFALRGSYFPESYYTQEAYQLVVSGDTQISQRLLNAVKDEIKKGNPGEYKTLDELRASIVKAHPEIYIDSNTLSHIISLGEQIGYFFHKIDGHHDIFTAEALLKGAKYMKRASISLDTLQKYFNREIGRLENHSELKSSIEYLRNNSHLAIKLERISDALYAFYRDKIYIHEKRIRDDIGSFVRKSIASLPSEARKDIVQNVTRYLVNKIKIEPLSDAQIEHAILNLFSPQNAEERYKNFYRELHDKLGIKKHVSSIWTRDENMSLLLNALLGKTREQSPVIQKHFQKERLRVLHELRLDQVKIIKKIINKMIFSYMHLSRLFFALPENKFDPYAFNYREIDLEHTYNPHDFIHKKVVK